MLHALFASRNEVKKVDRVNESLVELKETQARLKELYEWTRLDSWTWQAIGAVSGLGGGILAGAAGALLSVVAWARGDVGNGLSVHNVGSALLLSTIPLLILGAHCLDLLDKLVETGRRPEHAREAETSISVTHARRGVAASVVILALICATCPAARAQQTIFNVPSSDVLFKGNLYGEFDASFKPAGDAVNVVGKFSSFVPRVVVGVGRRVEVGLNVTGNIQPGADTTTLVPAVKWKAYDGGGNGWAIVLGGNAYIPVRNRSYNFGNYFYAQASKTLKSKTRLTAGGYLFTKNVVAPDANRAGGQFGFEQPFTERFGVAADWFTGRHAAGYFTPGFIFKPTPKVTGYFGYSIGNQNASRGNHYFLLELGYNIN